MDFLLSIGIDKYYDKLMDETPCAENDAREFQMIMTEQFNLEDNTLLVGIEATKENISTKVNAIADKVQENDRVFFYFAGHGSNIYNEPRLACYDSKRDALQNITSWYDLNSVMGRMAEKKTNLICFIDACESSIHYTPRGISSQGVDTSNYIYVFSAANYSEKANSDKRLEHGIWTKFLLDALKGDEEALFEGNLTSNSLQNFLSEKVTKYYYDNGEEPCQKPQAWGKLSNEFVIKSFEKDDDSSDTTVFIKDIYFGTVDADNEMKEEPQRFVDNYFDFNSITENLLNKNNLQFVIGRKGTGKTYTGMYMEQTNGGAVKYLAMDSFDYKALHFLGQAGNGYEQYVLPWKYYIFSQILIHLNKVESCEEIGEVLTELYGRKASTDQILHRKYKRGIELQNEVLSNKWKKALAKKDNHFSLQEITQIFSFLIEDYVKKEKLLILDGLDEKINENSNYKDMMNGLIWAVKGINDEMYNEGISLKVVAFFRKDVFELVQGANTAKIAVGSTVTLDWVSDADDKKKYPLYQFMNIRYRNSLKDLGVQLRGQELVDILPPYMKIGNNEKIETWDWILNLTTYKPRDVVKMLAECASKCVSQECCITEGILWEAQPGYSKYFVKELKNELYGFVDNELLNDIFVKLQAMRMSWREYSFVQDIIARSATNVNVKLDTERINEIINLLYMVGVFGVQLPNEHEHWHYRKYMKVQEYIEVAKYKLHPGLWKELSIW